MPAGFTPLTPYLAVRDARAAMRFYEEVFGAVVEGEPIMMDDGRVGHSELRIGDAVLFMADEFPEIGVVSPEAQEGSSVSFVVYVPDVDAAFERAVARGAVVERPVEDGQHGSRAGWLRDPFGHRWNIGTPQDAPSRPLTHRHRRPRLRAPIPEDPAPVQLGYFTLGSHDPATTRSFFTDLFGWQFEGEPAGGRPHRRLEPAGRRRAGRCARPPSTSGSTDIESFADASASSAAPRPRRAVHPSGSNVVCEDPSGVTFILWQPAEGY